MKIYFDKNIVREFNRSSELEWLETNGTGGWAGSTVSGANTRRYHGLLVAALHPPVGRTVLLSKLDETIITENGRYELSSNKYPGVVHPVGYKFLQKFRKNLFPEFYFEADGIELRKTVAAINGENTTVIIYEIIKADKEFSLEFLPLFSGRDYHSISRRNDYINVHPGFNDGLLRYKPYEDLPEIYLSIPSSQFEYKPEWYFNFEYEIEKERGLDFTEDLFTPGKLKMKLSSGDKFGVIISTENPVYKNAIDLYEEEKERRIKIIADEEEKFLQSLLLAADQFVVKREEDLKTIIAGYHWFSDWGRDTMIAFPGICLSTGRYDDAQKILKAFSEVIDKGMLPNRFSDYGEPPEYNTVDATLWFFIAAYEYYQYTGDDHFIKYEILNSLKEIIDWHYKGTRFNIKVDNDELLSFGEDGFQLTWMDVKIGDWVVTPRNGKAVEINALWYNALKIYSYFTGLLGNKEEAEEINYRAEKVKENFNKIFPNDEGYLYDYINGDYKDNSVRPNQLFALSLPYELIEKKKAKEVLKIVGEKLYTPVGLRSLSREHKDFKPFYSGDSFSRDSSYHQGTVWSWLLGPYIDALIRYDGEPGRKKAKEIIENLKYHLNEAGVGTISEIFDAEYPYAPKGCIAQAWSVGEILRVCREYDLTDSETKKKNKYRVLELT